MLNYLLFLSMVHEYAYFVMNIFGKRSIANEKDTIQNVRFSENSVHICLFVFVNVW